MGEFYEEARNHMTGAAGPQPKQGLPGSMISQNKG